MYSEFISMKFLGLWHMATTWNPLWKYGTLMKDRDAESKWKPKSMFKSAPTVSIWQVKSIRHINEWFKNHLKCCMISSDAHFAVLRKYVLVFTDLMKTACSIVAQSHWSGSVCHIFPFSCFAHFLSVFCVCYLFTKHNFVFVIYLMETAWSDLEEVCSSCFLPYKESRFGWIASKGSIIPGESYPSVSILMAVSQLLKDPPDVLFNLKSAIFANTCTKLNKNQLKHYNWIPLIRTYIFCLLSVICFMLWVLFYFQP